MLRELTNRKPKISNGFEFGLGNNELSQESVRKYFEYGEFSCMFTDYDNGVVIRVYENDDGEYNDLFKIDFIKLFKNGFLSGELGIEDFIKYEHKIINMLNNVRRRIIKT